MAGLLGIESITIDREELSVTWDVLRSYGREGNEGFVLWLGDIAGAEAHIRQVIVPEQHSIRSEDGIGYFVSGEMLFQLNKMLADSGLRLLAQIHSHPTEAYHSQTDDDYAIVTTEGGFSLVVPDFAAGTPDLAACAVYRLVGGIWRELLAKDVSRIWRVK